ncbi:hypothetical protein KY362_00375 [Candidatus Woesearchaeota archaeon]|nr:hypothetical protein [Candidatus Woesearchaeota archaeon]
MPSKPGRPVKSVIRQNIVEILFFLGEGYAYDIYRHYSAIFPKVTMRSIYYHLKKGAVTQEFVVRGIKKERGEYSWGEHAEKIYYALGPAAAPQMMLKVKRYFDAQSTNSATDTKSA